MPMYIIDNYLIFKVDGSSEKDFRPELSKILIDKFGKGPFKDQKTTREIINLSLSYFIEKFNGICHKENSVLFYQWVFRLHEDITEIVYTNQLKNLPEEIGAKYVAHYRRILKYILETACDIELVTGEVCDDKFKARVEPILNDLIFISEMILSCVELFAEQSMIEDLAEVSFTNEELYVFARQHHYEFIFDHISEQFGSQLKKTVVDKEAVNDLKIALSNCFKIKYEDVGHLIASIHEGLKPKGGDIVGFGWETLTMNLNSMFGVPVDVAEQFFQGLKLDKSNKMPLMDLVCKPYKLNRYMYRPILIWNIDGKNYAVLGKNAWVETIIQLGTNGIPWGKAPEEWMKNDCFKSYVHSKEDAHDKWLDDEVENTLKSLNYKYDRNVKSLNSSNGSVNINVPGLGEIDFIMIIPNLKKVFISDSKHLLGRYDMVNQKNDFNAFEIGSKKTKPYNVTMANKLDWLNNNRKIIQEHFQKKYNDTSLDLTDFKIEGIFVINTPTIYMYNSVYRIYTVEQIAEVLKDTYKDKTFSIVIDDDEHTKVLNVQYPYFKKPEYIQFDPFKEEEV